MVEAVPLAGQVRLPRDESSSLRRYGARVTTPTGRRPRNLFFYAAVIFAAGILYFLYEGSLLLAVVSGAVAVGCVFAGARPRGGT